MTSNAFDEGYAAARDNGPDQKSPYRIGTPEDDEYERGVRQFIYENPEQYLAECEARRQNAEADQVLDERERARRKAAYEAASKGR